MTTLPELINTAMNSGWTITDLAGASGVSQSHISKLRKSEVSQDTRQALRLRNFLEAGDSVKAREAASAALARVLARHPGREREIMNLIHNLDILLSGPPKPAALEGGKKRRGRKVSPLPKPAA